MFPETLRLPSPEENHPVRLRPGGYGGRPFAFAPGRFQSPGRSDCIFPSSWACETRNLTTMLTFGFESEVGVGLPSASRLSAGGFRVNCSMRGPAY